MYSESVLNSSYVDDVIETSKEVLAGLKMMLTFLSRATCPSSFTFFCITVTLQYASYLGLKNTCKIFLKNLKTWQYPGDMTFRNR